MNKYPIYRLVNGLRIAGFVLLAISPACVALLVTGIIMFSGSTEFIPGFIGMLVGGMMGFAVTGMGAAFCLMVGRQYKMAVLRAEVLLSPAEMREPKNMMELQAALFKKAKRLQEEGLAKGDMTEYNSFITLSGIANTAVTMHNVNR